MATKNIQISNKSLWRAFDRFDAILLAFVTFYLLICPYTKVEESFNLQAMHDMLFYGYEVEQYDHHQFPGVVPRTFLGSFTITLLSRPIFAIIGMFITDAALLKYLSLLLVRFVLGFLFVVSTGLFRRSFCVYFTGTVDHRLSACWTVIQICQFHLLFYASRPLPNTFALCLVLLGFHFWMSNKIVKLLATLTFVTVIFRSEIIVLLGPIVLEVLVSKKLPFTKIVITGIVSGLLALLCTISFDSFWWARWIYPEGELLYFNTVLNKSHQWGTSPFYWYFLVAIPKTLMGTAVFFPIGLYFEWRRTLNFLFPCFTFVALYSLLPHKELRFIFYVFPVINMVSALGLLRIWNNWKKNKIISLLCLLMIAASFTACMGLLYISSWNYPGASAVNLLHSKLPANEKISIHFDVFPCQTGFSRFLESNANWEYLKTENLDDFSHFDYRVTDQLLDSGMPGQVNSSQFHLFESISSFRTIRLQRVFPFIQIHIEPSLFIYKRNN